MTGGSWSVDPGQGEFARGWRVLLASTIGIACSGSIVAFHLVGPFTVPLSSAFGWGRGDIQLALLLYLLAAAVTLPAMGAYADRVGVRRVAPIGLIAGGLMFAALAAAPDSLLVYYLVWMAGGALGCGAAPTIWARGVNAWFLRRRGLALAIAMTGTGLTAAMIPGASIWLIDRLGWRGAFGMLALFPIVIALPVAWWGIRDRPRTQATASAAPDLASGVSLAQAAAGYRLWLLSLAAILVAIGMGGPIGSLVPLLLDHGFDRGEAAKVAGVIGVAMIGGRLLAGYWVDRVWAPGVAFPFMLLPVGVAFLLSGDSITLVHASVAAAMVGAATGAQSPLLAYITARYFGMRHYGSIFGLVFGGFSLTAGAGPFIFGMAFDLYGSYARILQIAALCAGVGAVMVVLLGRYPVEARPEATTAQPRPAT